MENKKEENICIYFYFVKLSNSSQQHQYTQKHHPHGVCWMHLWTGNVCPFNQAKVSQGLIPSQSGKNYSIFAGPDPRQSWTTHRATSAQENVLFVHVRWHCLQEGAAVYNRCQRDRIRVAALL